MRDRGRIGFAMGTSYLTMAYGIFAGVGYIIQFGLGRYLGPADYGVFGVILTLTGITNVFLTAGIPDAATKYIASDGAQARSIIAYSNRIQLLVCVLVFSLYFGLANVVAGLFNDPLLTHYIRLSAFIIPGSAFYGVYLSFLTGRRQFSKQAIAVVGTSLAKAGMVLGLVLLGLKVNGAIIGYVFSTLIGFLLAYKLVGRIEKDENDFDWKKLVGFGIPALVYSLTFYLLTNVDLIATKALSDKEIEVGYYMAASTVAKAAFWFFSALPVVLFPSISNSISANNVQLTRSYVRQSLRYMLMVLLPMVLMINAASSGILTLFYSSTYVGASEPLRILIIGSGMIVVFNVLSYAIMGGGKPMVPLMIAIFALGLDIGLLSVLIPRLDLIGAALGTTIAGFVSMTLAAAYVLWRYKALVSVGSLGKISSASAAIHVIALNIHLSPIWLPLAYAGLFILYCGLLLMLRELKKEDWDILKRIVPLKK